MLRADGIEITARMLAKARASGLPGFRSARVDVGVLLPALRKWLGTANGNETDKEALECQKLRVQIDRLQIKFDQEKADLAIKLGELMPVAEMQAFLVRLQEGIKMILRRQLRNDLPPKLVGLTVPEIVVKMHAVEAEIVDQIRYAPNMVKTARK